ncbi:anti-sigma factor domain-containing protein [Pseudonocardia xishanensis]|uniref:Regulator of SigK n=1 Tax=Pseudonocardia xishanensis TaxID=630995 RepID=A0ABP8S1Q1_9PSEU
MTAPPCPMGRELVGYALHALEPAEEIVLARHLRTCRECTAALPGYEAVLADLGGAVLADGPPAQLRRRILEGASARAEAPVPARALRVLPPPAADPAPPTVAPRAEPAPGRRPHRRRFGVLLAAACAIAVGGLAGQAVGSTGTGLDTTLSALETAGSVHSTLHDGTGAPVAAVVASTESVQVVVAGMPANDPTRSVYVLWGIGAGAPQPLGTFDAGSGGTRVVTLAAGGPGVLSYAVSLEPGRTAPAVPGTVVATGGLA